MKRVLLSLIIYHDDNELITAVMSGGIYTMDIECYPNYFLIAFREVNTKKVVYEESYCDSYWNRDKVKWIMENATIVTFNGIGYDLPIFSYASSGANNAQLKELTDDIIVYGLSHYKAHKEYNYKPIESNHIDLREVAPLNGSLKIYGGRVHTLQLQDLPFEPSTWLSKDQRDIVRWYCINDLQQTEDLYFSLQKELKLRCEMSIKYKQDLRSKSDAQIAEAVICKMIQERTGKWPRKPKVEPNKVYRYKAPSFVQFKTDYFKYIKQEIEDTLYVADDNGKIELPKNISGLKIKVNNTSYQMGIGGLHSKEKKMTHYSDNDYELYDFDVTSYYPFIILMQKLFPEALGVDFLTVFHAIVMDRLKAKAGTTEDDKSNANSLKIVINASFGKFGSVYSPLFGPNLLIQTTLTGQLALLMLIEQIELIGINVVSANTDGIVVKIPKHPEAKRAVLDIIKGWETASGYNMEETKYKSYHAMAVNDYLAIKEDGIKVKGKMGYAGLSKNPNTEVCTMAATAYLLNGASISETIRSCTEVTKFLSLRNVTGGAYKNGEFLGKVVRWYYSTKNDDPIIYAKSGKKVPKTVGAEPMMKLTATLPEDLDYEWYIEETYKMLENAGVVIEKAA